MNNELLRRIGAALYDDADPYQALRDCRAEIERLSKPYVPMTDGELQEIVAGWLGVSDEFHFGIAKSTQAAVIKRAGLEIKHD